MRTLREIAVEAMSRAKFDPIEAAKFMQTADTEELGDLSRYYVETLADVTNQVNVELPELSEEQREAEIFRRIDSEPPSPAVSGLCSKPPAGVRFAGDGRLVPPKKV